MNEFPFKQQMELVDAPIVAIGQTPPDTDIRFPLEFRHSAFVLAVPNLGGFIMQTPYVLKRIDIKFDRITFPSGTIEMFIGEKQYMDMPLFCFERYETSEGNYGTIYRHEFLTPLMIMEKYLCRVYMTLPYSRQHYVFIMRGDRCDRI